MTETVVRRDLPAPDDLKWIVRTLTSRGFEAWAVGGGVRDALSGRVPGDWDVTTSAPPREVQRAFRKTIPVGIAHGTVGVLSKSGQLFEVTTFRRDVETDGRHARVVFSQTLEEDLARRDFTINAVAWHPLTGEVRDPHGGMADLERGVLRTVGDPDLRFEEDRLRVLRALRFAGTFDLRIEPETWTAIRAFASRLDNLSPERIREELWKVLTTQARPSASLHLYAESGALAHLYPEIEAIRHEGAGDGSGESWQGLLRCVDSVPRTRPILRLAILLHKVGGAGTERSTSPRHAAAVARGVLQRLRFSNAIADEITHLIAHQSSLPDTGASDPAIRGWVRVVGREYVHHLFRFRIALHRGMGSGQGASSESIPDVFRSVRRVLRERPPLSVADLAVNGGDLRAAGIPPGPHYGRILGRLLDHVIEHPEDNEREKLLNLLGTEAEE